MRRLAVFALVVGLAVGAWLLARRESPLPADLSGSLVYVSDRAGVDTLYARRLPSGDERRLTYFTEPARNPALSPDAKSVAFDVGGRLAVVELATGNVSVLSFGVDWRDAAPAWRPDARALVFAARRPGETATDIQAITPLDPTGEKTVRIFLTQTKGLDESEPVFSPDGSFVVFVREDNLYRVDLSGGRTRRITGGFRRTNAPRFLRDGRLMFLWRGDKSFGADVLDAELKERATLWEGTACYRSLAPSPDGRYFAASYSFDLRFHPADALRPKQVEEVRLLNARGELIGPLLRALRFSFHSPQWAP